ncbi:CDP-diacylglycerol--glycerol-3-phosphate 3-phosphatidyltransferase, mitochondrial isoform X2 [Panulirus ornatus]
MRCGINVVKYLFQCAAVEMLDPTCTTSPALGIPYDNKPTPANPVSIPLQETEETRGTSQCPLLPPNFQWLQQHCPGFPINGSKVRVISDPNEFYKELLTKTDCASQRISMSSLYLGTGKLEEDLVSAMRSRVAICKDLHVRWLLDFTRGSRGDHNSRKMLQPLITNHPETCSVSLYHTPDLRGVFKWMIPQRWNETIGLQHMKLYVFDNSLIISGANLSNDYFTNRQDRYFVFDDCPELANFYHSIIDIVSKFSLQLQKDDSTSMLPEIQSHPFLGDYDEYCSSMRTAIQKVWMQECRKNSLRLQQVVKDLEQSEASKTDNRETDTKLDSVLDTIVFPTLQMGPFQVTNDSLITRLFLTNAADNSKIQLASGYFNLTEEYMRCVLQQSTADYNILMAHPKANGFLGASGFAGAIPAAYTQLAKTFFERLQNGGHSERISMFEYQRPGWTFHAKGLWYYQPGQSLPFLTMIGSPNFGWRSVKRDLESQVILVTKNAKLQTALHREQEHLYKCASQVTRKTFTEPERLVPYWVRCVMPIIKAFF